MGGSTGATQQQGSRNNNPGNKIAPARCSKVGNDQAQFTDWASI
jgi:hypothetical protein